MRCFFARGNGSPSREGVSVVFENAEIVDLGRTDYKAVWDLQLKWVQRRAGGQIGDRLLLCEHDPAYTFGRSMKGKISDFLPAPAYEVERGGKATYHGPGQLVIYPITKLPGPTLARFIREMEEWIIHLLKSFGVSAVARAGETGVWVENRKIASIGIAVKRWVTYHGAALNVNPDLSAFHSIQPCGYAPDCMTSLQRELLLEKPEIQANRKMDLSPISVEEVKRKILQGRVPSKVEALL